MQTQHKNTVDKLATMQATPPAGPRNRHAWLTGLGAFIVVLLVIGASITVFTLVGQRQDNHQHTPTPVAGQWKQVQSGYLFYSMQAAPSNPAVLYACATASSGVSNTNNSSIVILRSADFGDHWQNVGANVAYGGYCDLAINPTNANDLYAIFGSNASQPSTAFKHSTDGGQTWTSITPALRTPGINTLVPWSVQQLYYDGHNLYGMQWIIPYPTPTPKQPEPAFLNRLARLVTSSDGGHTWSIIDGQFTAQGLGVQDYVVDPEHPGTIYEIAGKPLYPVEIRPTPTNDILPVFGLNQQLFKTTDNGASWRSLLTGLPYASQVQLASNNPQILYVGGIARALPLGTGRDTTPPYVIGSFHMQVSVDGGANWRQLATTPDEQVVQSWYVSADGHLYTSPTMTFRMPGVQPTAIIGTVVPVSPPTKVFGTPLPVGTANGAMPDIQLPSGTSILSYNPVNNTWSPVTTPPTYGDLLQVTPADAHGGAILWFMGVPNSHYALYRYLV
ncbi:MAG TPA: sialidase family protein [Ktedonobacteraceae bacterium]|nr:sialidase family protein [Ktedonobacteraceae bacterium]